MEPGYPILSSTASMELEAKLLGHDEEKTWEAMSLAGEGIGKRILEDYKELGKLPQAPRVLILLGKGHNAGDALIAGRTIWEAYPQSEIEVLFALGHESLKPLVRRAYQLTPVVYKEVTIDEACQKSYTICIDGVLGMAFKPPVKDGLKGILERINAHETIELRAAVDIPSGYFFKADFTYATGIAKAEIFEDTHREVVGRIRFIDIGFFENERAFEGVQFLLRREVLSPLKKLRNPQTDKRTFGHLLIVSGSRRYSGALLMAARGALQAGVGLVTICTPQSVASRLMGFLPEAMFLEWEETPRGALKASIHRRLVDEVKGVDAILTGPGLGEEQESLDFIAKEVLTFNCPVVLDANALTEGIVSEVKSKREQWRTIATPHLGEFKRMTGGQEPSNLLDFSEKSGIIVLLKGAISKISCRGITYYSPFGGPVLARGGSGDILSGMIGGGVAQAPEDPLGALIRGVVCHGMAADLLAQSKGHTSVRVTELFEYLHCVTRK